MAEAELNLDAIASRLEALEETIIHRIIDRAQWCVNDAAYLPGMSGFPGGEGGSLFELRLRGHEELDARFGRFCVPEERPFTKGLPKPQREVSLLDTGIRIQDYDAVNLTQAVASSYRLLLPNICQAGDDGQYGSSVEHDVYALQAISRRLHYGAMYVAECKFRADPAGYAALIAARDRDAIVERLTRKDVEKRIIDRVRAKVKYLQARVNAAVRHKIRPEPIIVYYSGFLIPMTKQGQALYLLGRTGADAIQP